MSSAPRSLTVAGALVEPGLNRVTLGERVERLEPKIMDVLLVLASRPNEVVSKDELLSSVWNGTFVSEDVLTRAIGELRKLFGDDPLRPHVIETIRKRGYRLIAPVGGNGTAPAVPEANGASAPAVVSPALSPPAPPIAAAAPSRARRAVPAVLALLAFALVLVGLRAARSRPKAPVRIVPLTSLPGNEIDAALSPDGARLAFSWRGGEEGPRSIWLKALDAPSPSRVTKGDLDRHPVFSPDGQRLYFTRVVNDRCRLLEISASGVGPERELGACGEGESVPSRLTVSSDGAWIAMRDAGAAGTHGIVLVSPRTLERRLLTRPPKESAGDEHPAFSPDGRALAFVRSIAGGVDDVYVVPVAGGAPRRVTFDNAGVEGVEWSPDGRTLAFSSGRAGLYSLWTVSSSGGAISWLAGGGSKLKHPTGVPRRNALAYENWIYEVNLWSVDGAGAATRITTSTDEWEYHPEVSPDGTRVAFVSTRSGNEEIWITGIDGRDPSQVTSFRGPRVATPRFSPDGRSLVFTARPEGRADVYVVDLASRATRRVTDDPADDVTPSFTRDGASILFSSRRTGEWEVWRAPAAGGAATRLTTGGGSAPAEGPDGSIWFVRLGARGLSRIPASGGATVLAVPSLPAESHSDWRLTKEGVLYKSGEVGDGSTISLAPYDGGAPRVFATLVNQAWPGFAVAPDGKTLVYGRSDRRYVDLKMIENAF